MSISNASLELVSVGTYAFLSPYCFTTSSKCCGTVFSSNGGYHNVSLHHHIIGKLGTCLIGPNAVCLCE